MYNLVLFGPPGSGKGTQAAKLVDKYKLTHVSTGELLRQEIRQGSPIGLEAKAIIERGDLVPDEVVIELIRHCIENRKEGEGFIFDGFPRTIKQAEALDNLLQKEDMVIDKMITLEVEESEMIRRILLRGEKSGRAEDKNEEIIRNRLKVYQDRTLSVAEYYKKQSKHIAVNNMGAIEDTFVIITTHIDG